ncbi:MAG: hypothetical protein KZQ60_08260, partial [Candidatus Thiodiazotropha sp. (ex Lucinoma aequizonata)]|nr:hypothetical protein [Candidatus Thiodiazotropha sp. (ex Lucinoma aequizonata)]
LGCALCMPFISPFRSPFRPYNRAYAYRGLTAFAPLSMAVSERIQAGCDQLGGRTRLRNNRGRKQPWYPS